MTIIRRSSLDIVYALTLTYSAVFLALCVLTAVKELSGILLYVFCYNRVLVGSKLMRFYYR